MMCKGEVQPLMLQYKDHHTAYGPLVAGPHGLTFIALRNRTADSAPVYLSKPATGKSRNPASGATGCHRTLPCPPGRSFSTARRSPGPVYEPEKIADELAAHLLRLGAGMSTMGPDPKIGGGYYVFVANGSLEMQGEVLPAWSMVYVEPDEEAIEIKAGRNGLEALVMQFPRDDE